MKQVLSIFLFVCAFVTLNSATGQSLVINELQSRNFRTLADGNGDFEDWCELKNISDSPVNLAGYGLSDDQSQPFRWIFPDVEIQPGEFLLVWLSGKNKTNPSSPLHTNFSLTSTEPLLLVNPDMSETDIVQPVELIRDVSYGRSAEAGWAYFAEPTPGAPNLATPFFGICAPPTFSHSSGFYEDPFQLMIFTESEGEVFYTLDGSEPSLNQNDSEEVYSYKNSYPYEPSQPFGPFLTDTLRTYEYTNPISIVDRSPLPDRISQKSSTNDFEPDYFPDSPSYKGTVVRARTEAPGLLPSEIVTRVFYIAEEAWNRYDLPVVSVVMSEVDLFEYSNGIQTAGETFDIWRENNPDDDDPPNQEANYGLRGILWERPAWVEFFDMENQSIDFSAELGVRTHGASSRRFARKSFRFHARDTYGMDQMNYPFFGEDGPNVFERLVLRNSGGDARLTNMRNHLTQIIARPMRMIVSQSRPFYVFLNGEFYGLNILNEHFDDNYFKLELGIDNEDLDLIKGSTEIASGNTDAIMELDELCALQDFSDPASYSAFTNQVEINSYIDVFVVNTIAMNSDMFPKNTIWWRDKSEGSPDDRFQSILTDMDRTWGHRLNGDLNTPAYDMISHYLEDTQEDLVTYLVCFINAMQNPEFQRHFINRSADMLNTLFQPERIHSIVDEIENQYTTNYDEHVDRWSGGNLSVQSVEQWSNLVDTIVNFSAARPEFHRQHIGDFFNTDGTYELVIDVSDSEHGYVHLNTIDLLEGAEGIGNDVYPWEGIYFSNVPVTATAIPNEGFVFSHWEGAVETNTIEFTSAFDSDSVFVKAVFVPNTLGVDDGDRAEKISVFPNPSSGDFTIGTTSERIKRVIVYDALGRIIFENEDLSESGNVITVSGDSGIYFLEISFDDGNSERQKLIKL